MSELDHEKDAASPRVIENLTDLHEYNEREGYVITDTAHSNLKRARDGQTILLPQPSDDKNDPLNWSWAKKHTILIIISMTAFLPDYGSATGAVTLLPQAEVYGLSPDVVNHSQVGNVFMLGAGGVVVVALSAYFGRLPVLFYFLVLATATAIWCAAAATFESFMAARILNGFFSTVAQGGGLMFIYDMVSLSTSIGRVADRLRDMSSCCDPAYADKISSFSTNDLAKLISGQRSSS